MRRGILLATAALGLVLAGCSQESSPSSSVDGIDDASLEGNPDELLWGDLHLHSNRSFDAFSFGTENLSPEDAYRFACGEAITSITGGVAQLERPLDFLMVSDHAEFLGLMHEIKERDGLIEDYPLVQR